MNKTEEFLESLDDWIEWLSTTEGDEVECISIENLKEQLRKLFNGESYFDTPKPVKLIKNILFLTTKKDDLILDFFAGSGTTGHSVLFQNKKENFKRQFILCTNNESNNGVEKVIDDFCYPRIKNCINEFGNNHFYH